jgi:hypothetical protein
VIAPPVQGLLEPLYLYNIDADTVDHVTKGRKV